MTARSIRSDRDRPLLDILSRGRLGPSERLRFTAAEVTQIARTVRRTPEVMLKVTGGGTSSGAVRAHFAYVSRRGGLDMETSEGERVGIDQHKALIDSWDLDLVRGQYRKPAPGKVAFRPAKLVHNIVLGMPSPTPPEKVLAAARVFAEKQFAQHRYALVLHTDQRHPHVHLVVRAENDLGQRSHIDKAKLRAWREDFAASLRAQGVAANATSRFVRGQTKKAERTRSYRAARHRRSERFDERLRSVATEMNETRTIRDPARPKLVETRRQLLSDWEAAAQILDTQGELELAGEVRAFARRLPPVRTDRERLGESFLQFIEAERARKRSPAHERARERTRDDDLTR